MIDLSAIAQGDALRAEIAAKTAAFEAMHGPIETQPILKDNKRTQFRIVCPERRAIEKRKASTGKGKGSHGAVVRAQNIEKVRPFAGSDLTRREIAKRTGLCVPTVSGILKELGDAPKPMLGTKQARDRAVLREVWP